MKEISSEKDLTYKNKFKLLGPEMFLSYFWILTIFIQAVSGLIFTIGIPSIISTLLIYSFMGILLLFNFKHLLSISINDIVIALIMSLSFAFTILFWPQNIIYITDSLMVFANCILFFFAGKIYQHCQDAEKLLYKASIVNLFLAYLSYFTSLEQTNKGMTFAYALLPSVILIINYCIKYHSKLAFLGVIFGIVLLFLLGTRGPLLFALIFLGYCLIKYTKNKLYIFLIAASFAFLGWVIISEIYIDWIIDLDNWLQTKNINSYILEQFVTENTASMDERERFSKIILKSIEENWLFGIGLFGDSALLGVYVHHFLLEILSCYGVILGSVLIIAFTFFLVTTFKHADKKDKEFIIILLFSYLLKLFFSSSFLIDTGFWFMMGMIFSIAHKSKARINNDKIL